jgi:hypothetical protein
MNALINKAKTIVIPYPNNARFGFWVESKIKIETIAGMTTIKMNKSTTSLRFLYLNILFNIRFPIMYVIIPFKILGYWFLHQLKRLSVILVLTFLLDV